MMDSGDEYYGDEVTSGPEGGAWNGCFFCSDPNCHNEWLESEAPE